MKKCGFRRSFTVVFMSAVLAFGPLSANIVLAQPDTATPAEEAYVDEVSGDTVSGGTVSVDEVLSGNETLSGDTLTVSEESAGDKSDLKIPVGVMDDDTVIENPLPLPQYVTPFPGGEDTEEAAGYAASYTAALPSFTVDQGQSSLCWAFAASMLGSINHLKKTGETVRYSPDQIGYFFYNRVDDPMHNTPGDSNYIMGGAGYNYFNRGGNNSFNTWSLASWISPRVYSELTFTNNVQNPDQVLAYETPLHLQNAYWAMVASPAGEIGYVENVKELIHDHGGVSATIYSERTINNKNASYTTRAEGGHNIVLVGWDDTFSKDNFEIAPPGDGAWYVRDSYDGADPNIKADGCYWLSYYDRGLTGPKDSKAIAFDFENGNNYNNNYQYDGSAGNSYISSGQQKITIANVFKTYGNEELRAVSFAPYNTSTDYTVKIYGLPDDYSDPVTGGTLLYTRSGSTRYVGYRTIVLDDPVSLNAGECFSVVIEITDTSGGNSASFFVESSGENGGWIGFTAGVNEKQSYIENADTYEGNYCVRIKAFTDNVKAEKAKATYSAGDYTYDGTVHKPTVTVKKGEDGTGDTLTENSDYTVEYENAVNAGTATIKIKSNNYTIVNDTFTYEIKSKTINDANITASLSQTSFPYDATAKTPAVEVNDTSLSRALAQGEDYDLEYKNNVDAGTASVVIKGTNNYKDQKSLTFTITGEDIAGADISKPADLTYNGSPQIPKISVKDKNGKVLTEGDEYVLSAVNNINAGTGTLTVAGKKNYSGTQNISFKILPRSAAGLSVTGVEDSYEYTGSAITPKPLVTDPAIAGRMLSEGSDYSVEYKNNIEEGNAQVLVKGMGNYTGEKTVGFFISKAPAVDLTVEKIRDTVFIPGGEPVRPAVKVKSNGIVLSEGGDYRTYYENNTEAGTATVEITGMPKTIYDNSETSASFTIAPFSLKNAEVSGITDQLLVEGKTYTVSPEVSVRSPLTGQMVKLYEDEDYELSYENNTGSSKDQKVTVQIEGINNYTGSIKKTFTLRSYTPMGDENFFDIRLSEYEYVYDGQAKKPSVAVIYKPENRELASGSDYKVTYSANKNAGNAKVTIKPTKAFTKSANVKGSADVYFSIKGKTPSDVTCSAITDKVYTGKQQKPKVKVYENKKKLPGSSYYVEYSENVNAGTAKYTVYGKKNYSGVLAKGTFVIKKRKFSSVKVSHDKNTGAVTVRYKNAVLRENVDYKNDAEAKILTSLQTNFEEGTKKYK